MSTTTSTLPTLAVGTWVIDPAHSAVEFTVRHLMVSKVRGRFTRFAGAIEVADDPAQSKVEVEIEVASVDTHDATRDAHLRTGDFFDADEFPTMTYRSTGIRPSADGFALDGELTLHGVTRELDLEVEFNGTQTDPWGGTRVGFSATGEINRKEFGVAFDAPLEGGGFVVGDKVKISLEVEATLQG